MLAAIISMYKVTHSMLGMAVISAVVGVRQGSPTSCFLFILYVNVLIRNIKIKSAPDSFLGWLHVLMLMDDTVIFASSRDRLMEKLSILDEYCESHGMLMNEKKTEFMVINGKPDDCRPIKLRTITMKLCTKYMYLGSIFTADGSTISSVLAHASDKKKQLNKLLIFLARNRDMPFVVKRKVVESAFNYSILYGAECWLKANLQAMNTIYMSAIKALLSVRHSIPTKICLAEAGMPPLESLVRKKQHSFFNKMIGERDGMNDDPLMYALKLTEVENTELSLYIDNVKNRYSEADDMNKLYRTIRESDRTRFRTYRTLNPGMSIHKVYARDKAKDFIPEHFRIAFTRMRTSSHRLRVETGRWSGLLREDRICKCGEAVGDECHALTACKLTQHLRDEYGSDVSYPDILVNAADYRTFEFIYKVVKVFE